MNRQEPPPAAGKEDLRGVVEAVVYAGEEGFAWRVVRLSPLAGGLPVAVVGSMPPLEEGQELKATGAWEEHPRHGRQFRADRVEVLPPSTRAGVVRYLASRAIKGVGPKLAERIVDALGEKALERIEADPKLLAGVPGLGAKKAAAVAAALQSQAASRAALVFLRGLGLGESMARKVYQIYESDTVAAIRENPYQLAREVFGLGFRTADQIARNLGLPAESPHRLQAGVLHLLREAAGEGHSFLPLSLLSGQAAELLQQPAAAVARAVAELTAMSEVDAVSGPGPDPADPAVYPGLLAWAEKEVAAAVRSLLARPPRAVLPPPLAAALAAAAGASRLELKDEQEQALHRALTRPLSVITGGPGVGKTTLVRVLVAALSRARERVLLCAPTGRAARRLAEVTGQEAATIHRTLGYHPHHRTFQYNARHPLETDLLVVDEVSMVDIPLAARLLAAVGPGTRVVLVGDADQLPSVGPGNFLGDLVGTPGIPVTRLTRIFRQQERSLIVENAHRILAGRPLRFAPGAAGDFFFIPKEEPAAAREAILRVVVERIPRAFGLDPAAQVQVLAPMYRGEAGADRLNAELQARLVPPGPELRRGGHLFRRGDKVIQIRNDYDRELFNGDLGRVEAVDPEAGSMEVRFDRGLVSCGPGELDQLLPAFAISVHRAQGSEFPAVVIPLTTQHYLMLRRHLLYTAVTRARRLVVVVGSRRALEIALTRQERERRYSGLAWRLGGASETAPGGDP